MGRTSSRGGWSPGNGDHREQVGPVLVGLARTDAVGQEQLLAGARAQQGEVAQAAVAGDDVGRHAVAVGELQAVGPEALEQRQRGGVEHELVARGSGLLARAGAERTRGDAGP
jgi:hypothetical protein